MSYPINYHVIYRWPLVLNLNKIFVWSKKLFMANPHMKPKLSTERTNSPGFLTL